MESTEIISDIEALTPYLFEEFCCLTNESVLCFYWIENGVQKSKFETANIRFIEKMQKKEPPNIAHIQTLLPFCANLISAIFAALFEVEITLNAQNNYNFEKLNIFISPN